MVYDVVAFYESNSFATLSPLNAVADGQYNVSGDDITIKPSATVMFLAFGYGANIQRAQLRKPQFGNLYLNIPIEQSVLDLHKIVGKWFLHDPIILTPNEKLNAYISQDSGVSEVEVVGVFLAKDKPQIGHDWDYILRLTGSATLTAGSWTSVSLTPDVDLPAGKYLITGVIPISANGVLARIVDPNSGYRPGAICIPSEENLGEVAELFTGINTGVVFEPNQIPNMEFLATAGDTSQVVYWFVKKVG